MMNASTLFDLLVADADVARHLSPAATAAIKARLDAILAPRAAPSSAAPAASRESDTDAIVIYTDGSCLGNPGPGGWAAVFLSEGFETSGHAEATTNNRMEIQAVIGALERVATDLDIEVKRLVEIRTDSKLVVETMQGRWKSKSNHDLWTRLHELARSRTITWTWVKGHDGVRGNERANALAQHEAEQAQRRQAQRPLNS